MQTHNSESWTAHSWNKNRHSGRIQIVEVSEAHLPSLARTCNTLPSNEQAICSDEVGKPLVLVASISSLMSPLPYARMKAVLTYSQSLRPSSRYSQLLIFEFNLKHAYLQDRRWARSDISCLHRALRSHNMLLTKELARCLPTYSFSLERSCLTPSSSYLGVIMSLFLKKCE